MNRYKKLNVWKASINLTTLVYDATKNLPSEERYGLTSQIGRAAVSIPSNIAEGGGRNNKKEFSHFVGIAFGSACELETLLTIATNTSVLSPDTLNNADSQLVSIKNMLFKLKQSLTQPST